MDAPARASRVLVTGASGFIGRYIVAALRQAGHEVVGCARNLSAARRAIPDIDWLPADMNRDLTPEAWAPRLDGVDAIVNCAGILQGGGGDNIEAIHATSPIALFRAAEAAGIRRVVQVSALGADAEAGTAYADSKRTADDYLATTALEWIVLRPSLVYARDSFGGTSLFRGLAALPWVLALPGQGDQAFQPVAMEDVASTVARLVAPEAPQGLQLELGGPEALSLRQILVAYRRWLGLEPGLIVEVPMALIRLAGRLADVTRRLGGGRGALSTTAVRQLEHGNTCGHDPRLDELGIRPGRFEDWLIANPAGVQDRWHGRLYFLRPALRIALGLFWLWTGIATAFFFPLAESEALLRRVWVPEALMGAAFWLGSAFDVAVGLALILRRRVKAVAVIGILATLGYLALLTAGMPELWLHPLGPLSKLLPIIIAMAVIVAIEDDR
ncbi:MAG: NAD(P)H-binding protein [Alphaproteobacteria bacterium]|nr:NAD(P)H-binding protein [Alphaproteobacteria bacterium]